jgi:DNA-binding GntR family transcriptional regulator
MPDAPTAVPRLSLSDHVAEALFQRLVADELQPGDRLAETQLAAELHVSRTPVREAMQRLTTLGLLEHDTYRGARVAQPSLAELCQVYEVRESLEGMAARLFALRAGAMARAELRQTWEALEAARAAGQALQVRVLDFNLHRQIIRGGENAYLGGAGHAEALMLLAYLVRRRRPAADGAAAPVVPPAPGDPHRDIMAAIAAHDAVAAEAAMRAHVRGSRESFMRHLDDAERRRLYPEAPEVSP